MQDSSLLSTLIMFIIIVAFFAAEILLARYLDRRRGPLPPNNLPYAWGYYFGIQSVVLSLLILVFYFTMPDLAKDMNLLTVLLVILFWGVPGYFVIQRKKWAWITLTILSMNFVIWIVNYSYYKNRREELE